MFKRSIKIFFLFSLSSFQLSSPLLSMDLDDDNNGHHTQVHCLHCSGLRSDCLDLKVNGKGASGKWLDNVTPKRGWQCTGADDLGDGNLQQCEMCEREQVRYIHNMVHGDQQPLRLQVGCVCSGYMEGLLDTPQYVQNAIIAAQKRTTNLQNRAARRVKFPNLDRWKTASQTGNPTIKNYDGYWITIFPSKFSQGKFSASIKKEEDNLKFAPGSYSTILDAKLAAFDYLYPPTTN